MSSKASLRKSRVDKCSNAGSETTLATAAENNGRDDIERHIQSVQTPEREEFNVRDDMADDKDVEEDGFRGAKKSNEGHGYICDELEEAMDGLADLFTDGMLSEEELQIIWDFIEQKLLSGLPRAEIARRIENPKQRNILLLLGKRCKESPSKCSVITNSYVETSPVSNIGKVNATLSTAASISPTSVMATENQTLEMRDEPEWNQFQDEHDKNRALTHMEREIWNAEMKVKVELAKDLSKELTAKIAQKNFNRFKATDCFERWARDLRSQLITIPLCGKRLDLGELKNPRVKPEPMSPLFQDNGSFDSQSYAHALLLYGLLEELASKTSNFIYSALTSCLNDNNEAMNVVRSESEKNFYKLFRRLSDRFKKNAQLEKERLMEEFKSILLQPGENLRTFYGRLTTLVNELRNIYKRVIPDEDVRSAFKAQLSDTAKNNFLQLEKTPEYGNNLNDLCLEIIKRDEELQQTLGDRVTVNNVNMEGYARGACFKCGKLGHKAIQCRSGRYNEKEHRNPRKRPYKSPRSDNGNQLQVTIDGDAKNKRDRDLQGNLVSKPNIEYDESRIECYICHARGDHDSYGCPNGTLTVKMNNRSSKENELKNAREDAANPSKKYRLA